MADASAARQARHRRPWVHLRIELDVGCAEADEAREQRLVQVAVLLDCHVLHHRRQLVVVPDQDHALEPVVPILLALQGRQAAMEVEEC